MQKSHAFEFLFVTREEWKSSAGFTGSRAQVEFDGGRRGMTGEEERKRER